MKYLVLLSAVLSVSLAQFMLGKSDCKVGDKVNKGNFYYECVAHKILGNNLKPAGCVTADSKGEKKYVAFGEIYDKYSESKYTGFRYACNYKDGVLSTAVTGCIIVDGNDYAHIPVNSEKSVTDPYNEKTKIPVKCSQKEGGVVYLDFFH